MLFAATSKPKPKGRAQPVRGPRSGFAKDEQYVTPAQACGFASQGVRVKLAALFYETDACILPPKIRAPEKNSCSIQ